MPTFIHFVRHAQGFHNLTVINQQIPDPGLTPHGKQQCAELCRAFPYHDQITHLVASPMRRTLYTCLLSFAPEVEAGKVVKALPEIQEVSSLPCDIGSSPKRLQVEFDPSQVDQPGPGSRWAPEMHKLDERARAARLWLRELGSKAAAETGDRKDVHIVAVTHGGFLHFLTQDWDGMDPNRGTGWDNTEYRSYEFVDLAGKDPNASLRETKVSYRRRRGSAKGLTDTEQVQLRAVYQERLQEEFGIALDDEERL